MSNLVNPNPAGWRQGDIFVNLSRVLMACVVDNEEDEDGCIDVRISFQGESESLALTREEFESLLQALEIYWSGR